MIKIYKNWKYYKKYDSVNISNIIACAQIMKREWIVCEYPWKDLMRKSREKWFILEWF